jgi:hypothetical protein
MCLGADRADGVLMLPTECNLPDLSSLENRLAMSPFLIHLLIGADNGFPDAMSSYRRNIVRLADKAVRDYMDVRRCVHAQIHEMSRSPDKMVRDGRPIFMFQATNRLEDCILTVGRLFRYFEKVRADESGFPINRLLRRRVEAVEQSIRETRNLIEHLYDDISGGKIEKGQNTAPALDGETRTISLAGLQLPVGTLATAIQRFHEFAVEFAQYRCTPDGRYELVSRSGSLGGH